jgi:hypothetical protein
MLTLSLLTSRLFVDVVTTINRFKAQQSGSHVYKANGRAGGTRGITSKRLSAAGEAAVTGEKWPCERRRGEAVAAKGND